MTGTAVPEIAPVQTAVPTPRPAVEQDRLRRRERPPSEYWDVFEACWRRSPAR
jgi:hypothetical protein